MMHLLSWLAVFVGLGVNGGTEDNTKYIKVDSLDRWKVLNQHDNIFTPNTLANDGNGASHSVHVSDERGKYMKLDYSMNHPSNAAFMKLEKEEHCLKIKSIECNENNEMKLHFSDKSTMNDYYSMIENELSNNTNDYFIVGSYSWKCKDYNVNKYYPIMRRINSIVSSKTSDNEHWVMIKTSQASYLNVFENLEMTFETNMKLSHESVSTYKEYASNNNNNNNNNGRRILSWLSDTWDDIVDGVEDVGDAIEDGVDDIVSDIEDAGDDIEDVIDVLEGKNVTFWNSSSYTWSYNYDETNGNASSTFYLDDSDKVKCINCYAYFDLTYTYSVKIVDRSLYRLYMVGEGDCKVNVEIEMEASFSYEYDIDTPDVPIPYLSVDVFGIDFGFVIYGAIGIGVYIEMDYIYVGGSAYGSIKRGIEYYGPYTSEGGSSSNGTMQYITDESFDHTLIGPKLEFSSANITLYLKPTLYLELTYVGDVYFGIQPEIELSLTKDASSNVSTDCAIDYTPTAKLLAFVGADLDPLDLDTIWKKELSLTVVQVVLTTLEGCITEAELTTIESYIDELDGDSRRRLSENNDEWSNFYLDYTRATTDRYSNKYRWGKRGTEWWGNLTTLNLTGNAQTYLADEGKLLLHNKDTNGNMLIGLYITTIDNWYLPPINENESGFYSNVSCISRTQFNKLSNSSYSDSGIFEYNGVVLEYVCDVNDTYLFNGDADSMHSFLEKITLSGDFYALMLDTHFRSGFWFDADFNRLFALSQKRKHENSAYALSYNASNSTANVKMINARPSQGWFGDYHCKNGSVVHVTCYFQSYDETNGNVSAVLDIGSEQYWLHGTMSFSENRLYLESESNDHVSLNGYLTLFDDGTILYTGPALDTHQDCTGFVLQGYMDASPLDSISNNENVINDDSSGSSSSSSSNSSNSSDLENGILYGALIAVGAMLLLIASLMAILRCNGYQFCVKPQPNGMNGYAMMDQDQQL